MHWPGIEPHSTTEPELSGFISKNLYTLGLSNASRLGLDLRLVTFKQLCTEPPIFRLAEIIILPGFISKSKSTCYLRKMNDFKFPVFITYLSSSEANRNFEGYFALGAAFLNLKIWLGIKLE
ncbi:hypothetical protein BpHYR1_008103 [Brachionus plicatilis]|uniref:Uncharacterized protein n=1 Tax=Brachionus plicatilis TaxID=10195 RepID=A0A3M7QZ72_BRAPC|nr:hypothetical protein BpHYR1_008103 [Brachionus plicatilis]